VIDLHLHTPRCGHACGTIEEYVAAARRAGVTTMCFTDHLPLPEGYPAGYAMSWPELPLYVDEVRAAAVSAAADGGPEVLCGVEADWTPDAHTLVTGAVEEHGFDVVLGSVHMIDGWAFDDPDEIAGYESLDIGELWDRYFTLLEAAAASGLYDVMAHPDLVKKFGFFPESDPAPWYEEAATVFAESGVAVEVNAAGLRKPVGEIYPSLGFLKACRSRGVPATTGSDAHRPDDVGSGLVAARILLEAAGYSSLVVFRARVPEEVAL
jgi:histidinol-phosphatase (PHP family)